MVESVANVKQAEQWIGIDLGTCNTVVGLWTDENRVEILQNNDGKLTTPSVVGFRDNGDILVGDSAVNESVKKPGNTIFEIKRLIGKRFDDPLVTQNRQKWPFEIVEGNN